MLLTKSAYQLKRKMGFALNFNDTSIQGLLSKKREIISSLEENGCICIKNVNF
jgi:hypothetical protein